MTLSQLRTVHKTVLGHLLLAVPFPRVGHRGFHPHPHQPSRNVGGKQPHPETAFLAILSRHRPLIWREYEWTRNCQAIHANLQLRRLCLEHLKGYHHRKSIERTKHMATTKWPPAEWPKKEQEEAPRSFSHLFANFEMSAVFGLFVAVFLASRFRICLEPTLLLMGVGCQGKTAWVDSACADSPDLLVPVLLVGWLPSLIQEPQIASICFTAPSSKFLDLLPQLPCHLYKNATRSTSFCNKGAHTKGDRRKGRHRKI